MKICYNKLQKLMIDNQMKRQDLMRAAEITSYAATKINKNEPVQVYIITGSRKAMRKLMRMYQSFVILLLLMK